MVPLQISIETMTRPKLHPRVAAKRKRNPIPLSRLQTSDAVKTVLANPRRLEELLRMLEDNDLVIRGRAAATLAGLSESRPEQLLNVLPRLRKWLEDDFDYARWHLVYAFGQIGMRFPKDSLQYRDDIAARLNDSSRIVRMIAGKALALLAARHPDSEWARNPEPVAPPAPDGR